MNAYNEMCAADPIGATASGVTINWSHNAEPGSIERALFVFTEMATGNQTTHEVAPHVHTCFSLVAGTYKVAVIAGGLEQYRTTLELRPGMPAQLSPTLNAAKAAHKTLEQVLERFELGAKVFTRDLVVPKNTRVVFNSTDKQFAQDWHTVQVKDVAAAKRILGNDDALSGGAARFANQMLSMRAGPADLASSAAREYIYGHSTSTAQWAREIDALLFKEAWNFPLFVLGTVIINAGGVLVIGGANANFFVCERLRMHVSSTLLVRGVGPVHVEPVSLETFC